MTDPITAFLGKTAAALNGHGKLLAATMAALVASFGWYGSYVRENVNEERDREDRIRFIDSQIGAINERIDGVEGRINDVGAALQAHRKEQRERDALNHASASRTEKMIERLLRRHRIGAPKP